MTLIIDFLFTLEPPSGNSNICIFCLLRMSSSSCINIFFNPFDYFCASSDFFLSLSSNVLHFVSLLQLLCVSSFV